MLLLAQRYTHKYIILCLFIALCSSLPPLMAQEESPSTQQEMVNTDNEETPDDYAEFAQPGRFMGQFTKMMVTLVIFVGLIFLLSWLLKRMAYTRMQQVNTSSSIKVIERRVLSPKASLYIVEVYGNRVLIGETPAGLSTLTTLKDVDPDDDVGNSHFHKVLDKRLD